MARMLMKGNEAIGEAAIKSGCRLFFGYPITPQNEVAEYLSRRMPEVGGMVVAWAVVLGLGGFLVMALSVQYGVTHMPLHRSAVILLFELVVGAVSALLLTDEIVLPREWLGGGMIVLAAWVAAYIHAGEEA